jgi:hypothetical protein
VQAAIDRVAGAAAAHAISHETAVQMLINVGLPIDDAEEPRSTGSAAEMFDEAVQLLEATGDEAAVRKFLGARTRRDTPDSHPSPGPPGPTPPAPTPPAPAAQ